VSVIIAGTYVEKKGDSEFNHYGKEKFDSEGEEEAKIGIEISFDSSICLVRSVDMIVCMSFVIIGQDKSITFKAGRCHLLPIGVEDIFVANLEQGVCKVDEHVIAESPKRKKAKPTWMKQYLCGTKARSG
ncbi:hypothetical protein HAX54_033269, partial [Datura stramonium]|nr:hypothetical protein [Datura stramonium]